MPGGGDPQQGSVTVTQGARDAAKLAGDDIAAAILAQNLEDFNAALARLRDWMQENIIKEMGTFPTLPVLHW